MSTPRKLLRPTYSFTEDEARKAYEEWGANCGPNALAAMLDLKLDDVRSHIPQFDERRYTSPTMMKAALASLGVTFRDAPVTWRVGKTSGNAGDDFPTYGLARIQWHGPWMNEGVPIAARYRQTHWVGSMLQRDALYIFDYNGGWLTFDSWVTEVVPSLIAGIKRADGCWSVTHRWQLFV
jgi:hypothetical protein